MFIDKINSVLKKDNVTDFKKLKNENQNDLSYMVMDDYPLDKIIKNKALNIFEYVLSDPSIYVEERHFINCLSRLITTKNGLKYIQIIIEREDYGFKQQDHSFLLLKAVKNKRLGIIKYLLSSDIITLSDNKSLQEIINYLFSKDYQNILTLILNDKRFHNQYFLNIGFFHAASSDEINNFDILLNCFPKFKLNLDFINTYIQGIFTYGFEILKFEENLEYYEKKKIKSNLKSF